MTAKRWLILIFVVGAALRLYPLDFGLPYLHARPDEEVATGIAVRMLERGDLNPHFFHWPSLTFYLFAAVFWLNKAIVGLAYSDVVYSSADYFQIGRGVVAAVGASTMVLVYRIGQRVDSDRTGVVATAVFAVAILHVRESHFAMTDVLATCFATASLAQILRALNHPDRGRAVTWFAVAGFSGGLAASTKYNAAAVGVAMVAAQIVWMMRERRLALRPVVAYAVLFGVGFLAATPYALLDYPKFKEDLIFDITHLSGGHGINLGRGWIYHLTHSLPFGLGPTAFLAALIGIVSLVRRHGRYAFVIGSYGLALYIVLGSGYTVFFRYMLPLVPVLCVAAALGIEEVANWLGGRRSAYAALLVITIGPGLVNSAWLDVLLARTDSRVLAARWLAPQLQREHTLHDAGGPYSALDLAEVPFHEWRFDADANSFGAADGKTPDWLVLYDSPLHTYTRMPWQLRTLAATRYTLVHSIEATTGARRDAVYDLQDAFFMPVWGFWTVQRPGPTVLIYRLKPP